jgi:hypothetical protein
MVRRYEETLGANLKISMIPAADASSNPIGWQPGAFPATAGAWQRETRMREVQDDYVVHEPAST